MAEYKQYITQNQENGSVMISEEVLVTIIAQSVCDVEGVVGLVAKPGSDIIDKIGIKSWGKGIKALINEDDSVDVDCNISVAYNSSVVAVASAVQESITGALESMTGVKVNSVNVNVCGIVRQ